MNHALKPLTNDQKAYWQGDSDLIFIRGPNSAGKGINKLARGIYNYICYKTVSRGGFAAPILLFTGHCSAKERLSTSTFKIALFLNCLKFFGDLSDELIDQD